MQTRSAARKQGPRKQTRSVVAALAALALPLGFLATGSDTPANAAVQTIAFEAPNNNRVVMGDLASRTQRGPVTISGIGPYTVRGTDSLSGEPYEFVTDFNYNASNPGWQREGDERALHNTPTFTSNTSASYLGRNGVLQLGSSARCLSGNTFDGATSYCSMFGPDVYTETFEASVGQAVSFDWAAERVSDDYEVYAFLVKVSGTDYGTVESHTLVAYGRGALQGWTTASKEIPETGTYRFRFVNGTYDQTGGYVIGSRMYIDSVVKLGQANPIEFAALPDRVSGDNGPFTVSATAPGGPVAFSTNTTSICTVSGDQVTLTGTEGVCTVLADQAGGGDYVAAETVARSFRVRAEPTAPENVGLPFFSGTIADGSTITANEGSWVDGGSPITGTTLQWISTVDGIPTTLTDVEGTSCYLVESAGSSLTVSVTKTNSIGSTTASSVPISGYTCAVLEAPAWRSGLGLGDLLLGTPVSTTFTATGVTEPTYSVVDGALPDGLSLDSATGAVAGTPTTAGPYRFVIRATNPAGFVELEVTGAVGEAPGAIVGDIPPLTVGGTFDTVLASSGTPSPTFTITGGALPPGVNLDAATGQLSGEPTAAGPYSFDVTATNGFGSPATRNFSVVVNQAPTLIRPGGPKLPKMIVGESFSVDLSREVQAYPAPVFRLVSGQLPAGVTLNPATGLLSGEPKGVGEYSFVISVDNRVGDGLRLSFTVEIEESPAALAVTGAASTMSGLLLAIVLGVLGVSLVATRRALTDR